MQEADVALAAPRRTARGARRSPQKNPIHPERIAETSQGFGKNNRSNLALPFAPGGDERCSGGPGGGALRFSTLDHGKSQNRAAPLVKLPASRSVTEVRGAVTKRANTLGNPDAGARRREVPRRAHRLDARKNEWATPTGVSPNPSGASR
jgi:hypothetical protein